MHGVGNNTFHGIEQNEDSVYSSKENDESDIESGNYIFILNCFKFLSLKSHGIYFKCL